MKKVTANLRNTSKTWRMEAIFAKDNTQSMPVCGIGKDKRKCHKVLGIFIRKMVAVSFCGHSNIKSFK